ncbi:methyltransferase type 11 [Calothrix sp. FACHB-1219]|uniref:methyltransferase domain-containing protein n=1 Tax=unclassified Calothrix TaxID=2619626 RepID=UPI0016862E37|nr:MULTISPECIES: methyltransferase type 11 [unclassified Calothrix]MBD2204060.1 methyltransferase type 11 [Calothrix sp. FACHB-168]MBD2221233.1 methyltransferase type 11 [Calothrix sp. FACHB-1219]
MITQLGLNINDYLSSDRFISYSHQLRLTTIYAKPGDKVLEIGIFNSILATLLKTHGYKITTADIDTNLNPDLILDINSDFILDDFDVITAFQVLEHMEFSQFPIILRNLSLNSKYIIISLPYNTLGLSVKIKFTFLERARHLSLKIPKFWSNIPISNQHYWEAGLKGYSRKTIRDNINSAGLRIESEFIDPMNPYHWFLVLRKL